MELRQLKYFLRVAETLNFSVAARELFITQSTLSQQTCYVTILAESTVVNEPGLRAIPIDAPSNHMQGCIHTLKDAYQKPSAREFIQMLSQSTAILHNTTLADM